LKQLILANSKLLVSVPQDALIKNKEFKKNISVKIMKQENPQKKKKKIQKYFLQSVHQSWFG
jgi:hypothetical protein